MLVWLRVVLGLAATCCCWGPGLFVDAVAAPPERAFEQVSPAQKGADIEVGGIARAGKMGDAVAYQSFGTVAGARERGFFNQFSSKREESGWVTTGVTTPLDPFPAFSTVHHLEAVSETADSGLGSGWASQETGSPQMLNLWRWGSDGSFDLISSPTVAVAPESPTAPSPGAHFAGGSSDLRTVVFDSSRALTPGLPDPGNYLYRWFDGAVEPVGILPDGLVVSDPTIGYGPPNSYRGALYPGDYAVSADGTHVFFTTPASPSDPTRELYVRADDPNGASVGTTLHVSASERTDCAGDPTCGGDNVPDLSPDPSAPVAAQFQLASADGATAFFASPAKLTDDATATVEIGLGGAAGVDACALARCDLYRWDRDAPEGERLTDVTTADATGGEVVAAVGASEDATRIYFVAGGVLAAHAKLGEPNLYLWERGQPIRFIATLDGAPRPDSGGSVDRGVWDHRLLLPTGHDGQGFREARVTTDGRFLVFRSRLNLTSYDTGGHYELYRFDADGGDLICVSCNPRTSSSTGDAFLKRHRPSDFLPPWLSRNISTDGRVVFDSSEALVPGDTNGRIDVYEWADETLRLVSNGRDAGDSGFLDASADGRDVYFTTRARLVGRDRDSFVDLYDARIGGGIPDQARDVVCTGDACQGLLSEAPILSGPATEAMQGLGNVKSVGKRKSKAVRCRKGFARKRVGRKIRCIKRKSARRAGGGHR